VGARTLILGIAFALAAGCAGLKMENVDTDEADAKARGFRYYETSPFLLVHTDSKGGLKSEVLYLPDKTKKRSIEPYAYGASNKATLKFKEGHLIQAKAVVDETVVPVAIISALEKVASKAIFGLDQGGQPRKNTLPAPYLFRLVKSGGQWKLEGGQAIAADGTSSRIEFQP
jgi:hypothetical protein